MSDPYPNRNGSRREDDAHLLVRIAGDVAHWWNARIGWLSKTVTVLSFVGVVGGGIASGLIAYGSVRANFSGLPERVESLEGWTRSYVDTVTRPNVRQIDDNTMRLDSLRQDVTYLRNEIRRLQASSDSLRSLGEANNCWIRVAAGEESRFNCTGP